MRNENKKEIGDFGEKKAVAYLRRRGYTVMERNYRAGHYEIDIIVRRWKTLVFAEVKTRTYRAEEIEFAPPPGNAVKRDKQQFTRLAARQYLFDHPTKRSPRMDVIEVWLLASPQGKSKVYKIRHIKGAY
jgi:putative endonuclease